jgi:hypothetical protein
MSHATPPLSFPSVSAMLRIDGINLIFTFYDFALSFKQKQKSDPPWMQRVF